MFQIVFCVLALAVSVERTAVGPNKQDHPFRGSGETHPDKRPADATSGFTLDKLHGLPRTRQPLQAPPMYVQPHPVYVVPSYYPSNSYSLGGYYPQRSVGSGRVGVWLWAR